MNRIIQGERCGKTERAGMLLIAGLLLAAMFFLAVGALVQTTDMNMNNEMLECAELRWDTWAFNLLILALFLTGCTALNRKLSALDEHKAQNARLPALCLFLWILLIGVLWILMSQSAPTHDSLVVTRAGAAMANGDSHYIAESYYFRYFPFQLGYVLWTELWSYVLFLNEGWYLPLEIINVVCLAAAEAGLVLITDRLFHRFSVTVLTAGALALFGQPVLFCSFLYGNIPGFCFAVWGMYLFFGYCESDRLRYAMGSAVLLSVSVGLKLNNMIVWVAVLLIGLLRGISSGIDIKTRLRRASAVLLIAAAVLGLKGFGQWQYEKRTGKDFGDGIPMVCWLALGLHESGIGPGWYAPAYTVTNFRQTGENREETSRLAIDAIRERARYFSEHPLDAVRFFVCKGLSQWNETSFQSIWNNQVRGQYGEKTGIAAYVCGEGEHTVKFLMDQFVQLIYAGMFFAVIRLLHEKNPRLFLLPLVVLGGFLYHELFEAKSQYVLTYVILMIPYAVYGFQGAAAAILRLICRIKNRRLWTELPDRERNRPVC